MVSKALIQKKTANFLLLLLLAVSLGVLMGCEKESETLFDPDTYDPGLTPEISSISPADSAEAGSEIEIEGSNFMSNTEANYVYFGASEGEIVEASSTGLTVRVPSGSSGEVNLRVATRQAVDFSNSITYTIY